MSVRHTRVQKNVGASDRPVSPFSVRSPKTVDSFRNYLKTHFQYAVGIFPIVILTRAFCVLSFSRASVFVHGAVGYSL